MCSFIHEVLETKGLIKAFKNKFVPKNSIISSQTRDYNLSKLYYSFICLLAICQALIAFVFVFYIFV